LENRKLMRRRWPLVVLTAAVGCLPVFCSAVYAETETHKLPETRVVGTRRGSETEKVSLKALRSGRYTNLGEALTALPGVSGVKRAQSAVEPVIRGLGWERVQTQVDGLPVYGACPGRMDPPAMLLQPETVQDAYLLKGVPSVTLGPAGTGGRVMVSTDYERSPGAPPDFGGWFRTTYDSGRDGVLGGLAAFGGTEKLDLYGSFAGVSLDHYTSADGIEVPAKQDEFGGSVSLGYRPSPGHRFRLGFVDLEDMGIDYPTLPMNSDRTSSRLFNVGSRIGRTGKTFEGFRFRAGYGTIDHRMNNEGKSTRKKIRAETEADSDFFSTSLEGKWAPSSSAVLKTGADLFYLNRDALRARFVTATGSTFLDHIWPDALQWDVGAFAEVDLKFREAYRLRLGGRFDFVSSDARAADGPGLEGRTVRENYVFYYGPEAAEVQQDDPLGSGNVLLEWQPRADLVLHAGAGVSSRAAGVTERFFAFAPAPGGFQVGNPTLKPEIKYEIEGGVGWQNAWAAVSAGFFHFWFHDYIYSFTIDRRDVNGDGVEDVVRGFRNVDARLYGGEVAAVFKPWGPLSIPLTIAYVRGVNTSEDTDLPRIPPLEGRAAARIELGKRVPWWAEFGGRFAARQTKIDEHFPEDETAGFAVFHLRGGFQAFRRLQLYVGIENLFDQEYTEHLTPWAAVGSGDLQQGDPIPEPGRYFHLGFRLDG
jgi:iron complex outermembrane receptor protein